MFEAIISAPATRCFSTESAESCRSLHLAPMSAMRRRRSLQSWDEASHLRLSLTHHILWRTTRLKRKLNCLQWFSTSAFDLAYACHKVASRCGISKCYLERHEPHLDLLMGDRMIRRLTIWLVVITLAGLAAFALFRMHTRTITAGTFHGFTIGESSKAEVLQYIWQSRPVTFVTYRLSA